MAQLIACVSFALCVSCVLGDYTLTILHTNDVHARFTQTNKYGGGCSDSDAAANKCYGGVARRVTEVTRIREQSTHPVLLLDGGDQFQGTVWFFVYRGNATSYFTNKLQYDAMALGNHEFDNSISGLVPFLRASQFPLLSSNIDHRHEPDMQGLYRKSVIVEAGDKSVGIIGYTTRDTPMLADTGNLLFLDEVQSIRVEVSLLQQAGVDIIIALGHSGFEVDTRIARDVEGIDIVVGGHTNTFLYTGEKPSSEDPAGDYPHVVTHSNGGKTLVVQDYAFGKYLGNLEVTFDDEGDVITWGGNPILLDSTVEQDAETLVEVETWKTAVDSMFNRVIGRTHVHLEGRREVCRLTECNMGNFITDAMVFKHLQNPDETYWTNVTMAIMNSGGIRDSIEPGNITMGHLGSVLPYYNTIDLLELPGQTVWDILENSVAGYQDVDPHGKFLQLGGMRVVYDLHQPDGQRVRSVQVVCSECLIPQHEPLRLDTTYKVIMPSFIANGGDGYHMIPEDALQHHIYGSLDTDIVLEYAREFSPIRQGIDRRVQFYNPEEEMEKCSRIMGVDETTEQMYTNAHSDERSGEERQKKYTLEECQDMTSSTVGAIVGRWSSTHDVMMIAAILTLSCVM